MDISVECSPAYSMAYVSLLAGESFVVEHGAMAMMSEGVAVKGSLHGGVGRAIMRKTFGEESFFMGTYTAEVHGAWIAVAPPFPGDVTILEIDHHHPMICETGAVVGHADTVHVDVKYAGARAIVLREGAATLRLHGEGKALLSSYGGIQRFELGEEQSLVVDTGHLVAWSEGMQLRIGMLGGAVASQLTGEGLVARLTGPGVLYVQTRAEQEFKSWLFPDRAQNTGRHGSKKH